jgi:CCR4-NOT transcription complex subunit 1
MCVCVCVCVCIFFLSFPGIVAETKESFLKSLRRDFPRELVPVVLAPLLYPSKPDLPMDKVNQDNSTMTNTMVSTGI